MKRILLFACLGMMSTTFAQEAIQEGKLPARFQLNEVSKKTTTAVTDTIIPPFTCGQSDFISIYTNANDQIITGTYKLSSGELIEEVGQALNISGNDLDVYSILAITVYKEEGPSKGSFTAAIYDTTGGIASTPMATSNPVTYDNVNDTNSASFITRFDFSTPVNVTAPFWATLDVDNGSDTLSLASTVQNCGGASILKTSQGWANYSSVFTFGGAPAAFSIHLWAEVESNTVGLDRNFISRSGLEFFPNPAQDNATIKYDMAGESNITLLIQDISGRTVFSQEYSSNASQEIRLDLANFERGTYTYQLVGKKSQLNGVFVKQ